MSSDPAISSLVRVLDHAFRGSAWHGPTLLGSLRGVGPQEAAWRPRPDLHNVWEVVAHAAFWKYRVYLRLTRDPPRAFELKGTDWFVRPIDATEDAWAADVRLLREWHDRLTRAVGAFDPDRLSDRPGRSTHTFEEFVAGAAAHDAYHAGQVQLLKKLRLGE